MLNNPLIQSELVKAQQREYVRAAEQARQGGAATPDLPGMIERVTQQVWKRLGLPIRNIVARPLPTPLRRLPLLSEEAHRQ